MKKNNSLENVKGFKELTKEEEKKIEGGYSMQNKAGMAITRFFVKLLSFN